MEPLYYSSTDISFEQLVSNLRAEWGRRPICILACAGYSDGHWQIFHPGEYVTSDEPMPRAIWDSPALTHPALRPE